MLSYTSKYGGATRCLKVRRNGEARWPAEQFCSLTVGELELRPVGCEEICVFSPCLGSAMPGNCNCEDLLWRRMTADPLGVSLPVVPSSA